MCVVGTSVTLAPAGEILNTLGFKSGQKTVNLKDQETLIEMLYRFRTNLTPGLRKELTDKGIMATSLDALIEHSDKLRDADVSQEMNKGTRRLMTAEAVTEFNAIYAQLISINKIASNFYKHDKLRQALFSFSKVSKNMGGTRKQQPPTP